MKINLHKGCIMILGAPNDNKGNLSPIAIARLKQGAKELLLNPGFNILLTGGMGKHFNDTNQPHWKYAKDFLMKQLAVLPDSFLPAPVESTNTVEDIEKATLIFQEYTFKKIIVITSEFHLKRVKYIIERAWQLDEKRLSYSCTADSELEDCALQALYEHEKKAIDYLQLNYQGNAVKI